MKRTALIVIAALFVLALPAAAQFTTLNPQGQVFGYHFIPVSARAYAQNTIDTIPNSAINTWYSQTTKTFNLGAASWVSFQFIVRDSATVVFKWDQLEGNTYTAITATTADSVTVTQSDTVEIVLRSPSADRLSGIGKKLRARVEFRNVTQGTTTATWDGRWLWKP